MNAWSWIRVTGTRSKNPSEIGAALAAGSVLPQWNDDERDAVRLSIACSSAEKSGFHGARTSPTYFSDIRDRTVTRCGCSVRRSRRGREGVPRRGPSGADAPAGSAGSLRDARRRSWRREIVDAQSDSRRGAASFVPRSPFRPSSCSGVGVGGLSPAPGVKVADATRRNATARAHGDRLPRIDALRLRASVTGDGAGRVGEDQRAKPAASRAGRGRSACERAAPESLRRDGGRLGRATLADGYLFDDASRTPVGVAHGSSRAKHDTREPRHGRG